MTDRERYVNYLLGEKVDRPPFPLLWSPWGSTWRRWKTEGMAFEHFWQVQKHFGADSHSCPVPINAGPCPAFEWKVFEETDEHIVYSDTWGIKRRNLKGRDSMSEFIAFPVKDRADWERYKAERLNPDDPRRLGGEWRKVTKDWVDLGYPIRLGYFPDVGIFGSVRWLLGDEECLISFYTQPDVVHDIMERMTDIYLTVFAAVCREFRVDEIHIWEDLSGRQGPLISPAHWEEFISPCYRRIKAFAREHNIPILSVDTDGQPEVIVEPMMKAGVNLLFPLEVAAGCDVNEYQRKFPGLGMLGNIDKRELAKGPAAIDTELARIAPAVRKGRYIADLDHLVPDDVSWENYCYYAKALKKLVGA